MLNVNTAKPLKLIIILIATAKEFVRIHEEDDDYTDSAMTHVEGSAQWAWGVEAGKVFETKFMLHPEDGGPKNHSMTLHQQCIIPPLNTMTVSASAPGENIAVLN